MLILLDIDEVIALEVGPVAVMNLTGVDHGIIEDFMIDDHFRVGKVWWTASMVTTVVPTTIIVMTVMAVVAASAWVYPSNA